MCVCVCVCLTVSLPLFQTDLASLERIATACNADLRQMLNLLQMYRPSGPSLDATDVANHAFKDVSVVMII